MPYSHVYCSLYTCSRVPLHHLAAKPSLPTRLNQLPPVASLSQSRQFIPRQSLTADYPNHVCDRPSAILWLLRRRHDRSRNPPRPVTPIQHYNPHKNRRTSIPNRHHPVLHLLPFRNRRNTLKTETSLGTEAHLSLRRRLCPTRSHGQLHCEALVHPGCLHACGRAQDTCRR